MTIKENLKKRAFLEAKKNKLRDWAESATSEAEYEKRNPVYEQAMNQYYDFCRSNPTPTERRINNNRNFRRRCGIMD